MMRCGNGGVPICLTRRWTRPRAPSPRASADGPLRPGSESEAPCSRTQNWATVDKPTYVQEAPVRAALLEAQRELAEANFSVIVIVTGVGGAGKSETVNLLLEWLDARASRLTP